MNVPLVVLMTGLPSLEAQVSMKSPLIGNNVTAVSPVSSFNICPYHLSYVSTARPADVIAYTKTFPVQQLSLNSIVRQHIHSP